MPDAVLCDSRALHKNSSGEHTIGLSGINDGT